MTSKSRILVIEDDREIAELVQMSLGDEGYDVEVAFDGLDGLEQALTGRFGLLVLDLMLPGIDGLELCRRVRERTPYTMILMLTARSGEVDRVLGLELGADDYLVKPFSLRELQARVRALLRRKAALAVNEPLPSTTLAIGELELNAEARTVALAGREVHLTAKEFDLLLQFARNPGRVYTRAQLLDLVWGLGYSGFEHTVNSHINRLRAKIERDPARPRLIQTVWGVGYRLVAPEAADAADAADPTPTPGAG